MPVLPWIAALAQPVTSAVQSLFGGASAKKQNEASQKFAMDMYNRQRADAHSDWLMQNEYNSPKAMMQRFKDAGLNPNLVYGQAGNSAATAVRSSDGGSPKFESFTPNLSGFGTALDTFMDVRLKEAQLDNLEATNTVIKANGLLKMADYDMKMRPVAQYRDGQYVGDTSYWQTLQDTQLEVMKQNLQRSLASTNMTIDENARRALTNEMSLKTGLEKILKIKLERDKLSQALKLMEQDQTLKQLDIELRRNGLTPSSPVFLQVLSRFLQKFGVSMDSVR